MHRNRKLQVHVSMTGVLVEPGSTSKNLQEFDGAFLLSISEPVVRVELTGHCLNALVIMSCIGRAIH